MGVKSDIPAVPSIALGTPDLSLYEMVGAMNTFANKGVYVEPTFITKIEDKNGNILERFVPEKTEAMNEVTAYKMLKLMQGVVETGTGARLNWKYGINNPIAGKTGTTQNQSDGWFMGITPDLVSGVWVGGEDRDIRFTNLSKGSGTNMALPIWGYYMNKVYADTTLAISKGNFEKPEGPLPVETNCEKMEKQNDNTWGDNQFDL